jgi:hypothetical protein
VEKGGFRDVAFWRERLCEVGNDGSVLAYRVDLRVRVAAVSELREKDGDHLNYRLIRLAAVHVPGGV